MRLYWSYLIPLMIKKKLSKNTFFAVLVFDHQVAVLQYLPVEERSNR